MEQAIQKISELVSQLKSTQVQEQVTVDMSVVEEVNVTSSIEQMNADIASLEAEIEFLDAEEVSEEEGDCGMLATNLFVFNQDGSASLEDMKRKRKRKRKRSSMEEMKRKREVLKRKRMLEDAVEVLKRKREVLKRKREVLKRKREVLKRKREVQKRGKQGYLTKGDDFTANSGTSRTVSEAAANAAQEAAAYVVWQAKNNAIADSLKGDVDTADAIAGAQKALSDSGYGTAQKNKVPTDLTMFYAAYMNTLDKLHEKNMINSRKNSDLQAAVEAKAISDDVFGINQYLMTNEKDQIYKGLRIHDTRVEQDLTGIVASHDQRERANTKILKALA